MFTKKYNFFGNKRICFIAHSGGILRNAGPCMEPENSIMGWSYYYNLDRWGGDSWNDKIIHQLLNYDLIIINGNSTFFKLPKDIKRIKREQKILTFHEGGFFEYDRDITTKRLYEDFIENSDYYGLLHIKLVKVYKNMFKTPVFYMGVPLPPLTYNYNDKNVQDTVSIINDMFDGRGAYIGLSLAEKYQKNAWVFNNEQKQEKIDYINNHYKNVTVYGIHEHKDFLNILASSKVAIHTENRGVWGRSPVECAVTNVPCIGTSYSMTQNILYPELTVNNAITDYNKTKSLLNNIMENKLDINKIMEKAKKRYIKLHSFTTKNFENMMEKIL